MCLFDLHNVSADWPESVSMWSFHGVMLPKQMRWLRSLIVFAFFSPLCFHFFLQTDTLYKSLLSLQRGALNNITTAEYLGKAWHYSVIWNSEALMGAWETGRGATTGCAIPPTTFSQLIKLGSRPMRKTGPNRRFVHCVASRRLAAGSVTTQLLLGNLGADVEKLCSPHSPGELFVFWATSSTCICFNKTFEYQSHDKENAVQDFHQDVFHYL